MQYQLKIQIVHSETKTIVVEGDDDPESMITFEAIQRAIDDEKKKADASWVNILNVKSASAK